GCAANEITVVVPPNAAAVVALSKVSAFMRPEAESCSMWLWLPTPPGSTSLPRASISCLPLSRPSPIAAILPPRMPTSAGKLSGAGATVRPRITRWKGCMVPPVIPGRRAAASPESIATEYSVSYGLANIATVVFMDSGLLASLGPGMTDARHAPARYLRKRRLHHRGDAVHR